MNEESKDQEAAPQPPQEAVPVVASVMVTMDAHGVVRFNYGGPRATLVVLDGLAKHAERELSWLYAEASRARDDQAKADKSIYGKAAKRIREIGKRAKA